LCAFPVLSSKRLKDYKKEKKLRGEGCEDIVELHKDCTFVRQIYVYD
jgi:hypothetical protein